MEDLQLKLYRLVPATYFLRNQQNLPTHGPFHGRRHWTRIRGRANNTADVECTAGGPARIVGNGHKWGILGSLAPPWKHFGSNYVGVRAPEPAGGASMPAPGIDHYLSTGPGMPTRDDILPRELAGSAQTLPEPSGQSSRAFAGDHNTRDWDADGDPEVISDVSPDNKWILNAQYAAEGHHHNPRAVYEKLPLPPETRRVFEKATTGTTSNS